MNQIIKSIKKMAKIYFRYFINSAKSHIYYNDTFFTLFGCLARDSVAVIMIYFITFRFSDIGGWSLGELIFLYSMLYFSYGMGLLFFAGSRDLEDLIGNGNFDRYMVTPLSVFFQAIVAKVNLLNTFSYCLLGVILFQISSSLTGIMWNVQNVIILITSLIGGMLIQFSLLLLGSVLSFWSVKSGNVKFLLFFNIRAFAVYPINIYPKVLRNFLIFILPFAFVNYFPAKYILQKKDDFIINANLAYGSVIVGDRKSVV